MVYIRERVQLNFYILVFAMYHRNLLPKAQRPLHQRLCAKGRWENWSHKRRCVHISTRWSNAWSDAHQVFNTGWYEHPWSTVHHQKWWPSGVQHWMIWTSMIHCSPPEVMTIRCSTLGDMNIHDPLFTSIRCSTLGDMNIHDPLFTTRGKADLKSDLQTIAVHCLKAYGYSHQLFKIE